MKVRGNFLSWIVVKDLKAAIDFYTKTVGLTLLNESPQYGWAELSGPEGASLGIAQESSEMKAGSNAVMAISVEDLDVACDFYRKQGAKLVGEIVEVPGHVRMQTFLDLDGNMMQIVQRLA